MQRKKEAAAAVAAAAVAVASAGGVAVDEAHGDERAMIKTSRTEDGDRYVLLMMGWRCIF